MKKNKMMRLASGLLVATLLTTSVISGTFAKYVTSDSANDSARVAKWGVELQVEGNMFGDSYDNEIVVVDDANLAVQSLNTTDDVIAPGTENNDGFTFSLKGQPEVDGKVDVVVKTKNIFLGAGKWGVMMPVDAILTTANFDEFTGLYYKTSPAETTYKMVGATDVYNASYEYYTLEDEVEIANAYYPVIFKATGGKGTDFSAITTSNDTMKELVLRTIGSDGANLTLAAGSGSKDNTTGITTYNYSKEFATNQDLADVIDLDDMKVTWKWEFEGQNNEADTILGMFNYPTEGVVVKASGSDYSSVLTNYVDYCVDVMFDIEITVTQLD